MESFYKEVIKKDLDEFLLEVSKLNNKDKLDLVVLITARMREIHITTVLGREFWKKPIEEQMDFIEEIKLMFEKRDALLEHIKEVSLKGE